MSMGRNSWSKTGIQFTLPATCQHCAATFNVAYARRQDGPKPQKYCKVECYHAAKKGRSTGPRKPGVNRGGAPKGRVPWNKGKKCPQTTGERNGMYGKTHTPEARAIQGAVAFKQLTTYRREFADLEVLIARDDPNYRKIFTR